jgi:hypothetical protein
MTKKPHKPRVIDRAIPGASTVYEWEAVMETVRPRVEQQVRRDIRSRGGRKRAIGEAGAVKRAVRDEFPKLIASGISESDAVAKLAQKHKRAKSTIRRHVADLR